MSKLLIVDENELTVYLIRKIAEERGYKCSIAQSNEDALAHLRLVEYDVIVLDYMLGEETAIPTIEHIACENLTAKLILYTCANIAEIQKALNGNLRRISRIYDKADPSLAEQVAPFGEMLEEVCPPRPSWSFTLRRAALTCLAIAGIRHA